MSALRLAWAAAANETIDAGLVQEIADQPLETLVGRLSDDLGALR